MTGKRELTLDHGTNTYYMKNISSGAVNSARGQVQ